MFMLFRKIFAKLYKFLENSAMADKEMDIKKRFDIHPSVRFGYLPHVAMKGNVVIGKDTYFNSGLIISGKNSTVKIGSTCAIGYNVCIYAVTHDPKDATGPEEARRIIEKNVEIGNHVWIGNNVVILPGVKIGDYSVVGANAVVTKDIPEHCVAGGLPAALIKPLTTIEERINNESINYY